MFEVFSAAMVLVVMVFGGVVRYERDFLWI